VLGRQAKILSLSDVNDLLVFAGCTRHPLRNRVIVLLAAKAGLRAVEIAKLTWDMVLDPTGEIGTVIELRDIAVKNGSGRLIPVHPDLRQALTAYRSLSAGLGAVIRSQRGGPMTPLSIVVWFNRAFRNIGLHGCSSHSDGARSSPGRRGSCTRPVVRCATFSCSPVTGQSRRPNGTSTATAMCSASWSQ
jgi:integrase